MYESIEVIEEGKRWEIHARSHIAELPVWICGRLEWITWGRREAEEGDAPLGGWITEDEAKSTTLKSERGLVYALRFQIPGSDTTKSDQQHHRWHEVPEDYALDCIVLRSRGQKRAYVVTLKATNESPLPDRWPHLIRLVGHKA